MVNALLTTWFAAQAARRTSRGPTPHTLKPTAPTAQPLRLDDLPPGASTPQRRAATPPPRTPTRSRHPRPTQAEVEAAAGKFDIDARHYLGKVTALLVACGRGDSDCAAALLCHGADPNLCDVSGAAAGHHAVASGEIECMSLLLAGRIDVRAAPTSFERATTWLAGALQAPAAASAVPAPSDARWSVSVDSQDGSGETALVRAARDGRREMVTMLLRDGADAELASHAGARPLDVAASATRDLLEQMDVALAADDAARAAKFVDNGNWSADHPCELDGQALGRSPLFAAARVKDTATARELVAAGCTIDYVDPNGLAAVHVAAGARAVGVVELLLGRRRASPLARQGSFASGSFSMSPDTGPLAAVDPKDVRLLTLAALSKEYSIAKHVLDAGLEPLLAFDGSDEQYTAADDGGPLFLAAHLGHAAVVRAFAERIVQHGGAADLDRKFGAARRTALVGAAMAGKAAAARQLVEAGADASAADTDGRNALHHAALEGHARAAAAVLASPEARTRAVNARDSDLKTPLALAAAGGHESTVKLLLDAGADSVLADGAGATPRDLAVAGGHAKAVAGASRPCSGVPALPQNIPDLSLSPPSQPWTSSTPPSKGATSIT